jgi:plastocyanin
MPAYARSLLLSACLVLLILAVAVAGCTTNSAPAASTTAPAAAGGTDAIAISNFAFSPATLTVKPGTTVTWTNQDGVAHTIASDAGSPVAFTSDSLANGASYRFTFTQPGTYAYHCSIHPSMKGTIVVQS